MNPLKGKILTFYHEDAYDPEKFDDVKNIKYYVKPTGGLWTSPRDAERGFSWLCVNELYSIPITKERTKVKTSLMLSDDAKVATICNVLDIVELPTYDDIECVGRKHIDFEAISKIYDAIWLPIEGVSDNPAYREVKDMCHALHNKIPSIYYCVDNMLERYKRDVGMDAIMMVSNQVKAIRTCE